MPNLYDKNHLYKEFIDVTTKKFDEPFSCLGTASKTSAKKINYPQYLPGTREKLLC